jgi:dolichol-phosphate mannosyltransferase
MNSISVVVPAFNEEGNLENVVKKSLDVLKELTDKYEVLIINDGSIDNTSSVAEKLSEEYNNIVKTFTHSENKGMGAAIKTGFSNAKYDLIFTTCSDGQFDVYELKKIVSGIGNVDFVIAYRLNRHQSSYRMFNTKVYHILIRILFGLNVKDPSWVKLFRKKVIDNIKLESDGFFWETEILIKAIKKGYKYSEVGVNSYPRTKGKPSGGNISKVLGVFLTMLKFWIKNV